MQLTARCALFAGALAAGALPSLAHADDESDVTTTWFQERRRGPLGGLTVIHPKADVGIDLGEHTTLRSGYSADIVTGATPSVYSVDAVSTATSFDDVRHEGRVGLAISGSRSELGVTVGAGVERDYSTLQVTANGSVDLPGKNTNLALSYTHNFDQVCDRDNAMRTPLEREALVGDDTCKKNVLFGVDRPGMTVWRDLDIDTTQATVTQNLTPTAVLQVTLFGQILRGFQENPYRRVRVSGIEAQESVPDVRGRLAVMARLNKYLAGPRSAVHFSARGYSDTWGVNSASFEMAYSQYAGDSLLLRARGRVYQQTEATFFKDAFFYDTEGPAGAYFTGDRELAPLRDVVAGAKLSYISEQEDGGNVWGVFDEVNLDLKGDLLFFDELAADPTSANPNDVADQFLTGGQLLDGFVLQLGLRMLY